MGHVEGTGINRAHGMANRLLLDARMTPELVGPLDGRAVQTL